MKTLSLVMVTRDEASCVEDAIRSVEKYVDEIVVFDTGSSDDTFERCLKLADRGVKIKTDFLEFDFGQAKTAVSWMASGAYVLLLDADETLTGAKHLMDVLELMEYRNLEAVAFPRRRWADLEMKRQVEIMSYPDWQSRLYRNNPDRIRWNGALHETLSVKATPLQFPTDDPIHIEHFVDVHHLSDQNRRLRRAMQRESLAKAAGVKMEGSPEALRRASGG